MNRFPLPVISDKAASRLPKCKLTNRSHIEYIKQEIADRDYNHKYEEGCQDYRNEVKKVNGYLPYDFMFVTTYYNKSGKVGIDIYNCREEILGTIASQPRRSKLTFYIQIPACSEKELCAYVKRTLATFRKFDRLLKEIGDYKIFRTKYNAVLKFEFSSKFRACPQLISVLLTLAKFASESDSRYHTILRWLYNKGTLKFIVKDKYCAWKKWKGMYGFEEADAGIEEYYYHCGGRY